MRISLTVTAAVVLSGAPGAFAEPAAVQLGPRPFYLVERMDEGPLKEKLRSLLAGPFRAATSRSAIAARRCSSPSTPRKSYEAAARMGAGIIECDVTFTKDRQLVCRHSQCDLHTTTNILAIPELAAKCTEPFTPADPAAGTRASAKCCTSDITLAEFKTPRGQDGRVQPEGDHRRGVPGRHPDLPHRPLRDLRHPDDPRREHRADRGLWAPSSRPSSRPRACRCRTRATTRKRPTPSR